MANPPVARAVAAAANIAVCIAAFLRGNYLLGPGCGVMYVGVAAGLLWLLARSQTRTQAAAVTALSLAAGFVMAWPAMINSDVQHSIDQQAVDRAVRAELGAVFASDPAYRDLSFSTAQQKVVNVMVRGSVGTRADLDRLRARIVAECPAVAQCVLHWEIALRDRPGRVEGLDSELFGSDSD